MGQDVEGMGHGERAICLSLFVCFAVAVFSTVSLIYLTSIVYVPVQNELGAGYIPVPVMCTSIASQQVECTGPNIAWLSCYEWCISDPGGDCRQILAEVRQNGTNVMFTECTDIFSKTCLTMEDPPANETWDCKDIDNYQCAGLEDVFQCDNGICNNITSIYTCTFLETNRTFDCRDRKNCFEMTGLFTCSGGVCLEILPPWDCRRVCEGLHLGGGMSAADHTWGSADMESVTARNVVLLAGDQVVTGHCRSGHYLDMEQTVWDTEYTNQHMLFISCTSIKEDLSKKTIVAQDCINGSAFAWTDVPPVSNLTDLQHFMSEQGYKNKLDPTNTTFPFDIDIIVLKEAKLKINHGGCVNTLKEECTQWISEHSRAGANYTAKARFPCYIMNNNTEFVVTRHNVADIEQLFLLFLTVPLSLWCASCCCVVFISCCIKIDDWGHFRFSIISRVATKTKPQDRPRTAWGDPKESEEHEVERLVKETNI